MAKSEEREEKLIGLIALMKSESDEYKQKYVELLERINYDNGQQIKV